MKKMINFLVLVLIIVLMPVIGFGETKYRNKNLLVRETKVLTLKKNTKGNILYVLKRGRYRIRIRPNTVDFIDTYIVGNSTEINPEIEEDANIYEVDTNKEIEIFKQEYKVIRKHKVKIEIEKLE